MVGKMSKWVKFGHELPPLDWDMWISDGVEVWPGNSGVVPSQINKQFYWRDRINPAPPEQERHKCERFEDSVDKYEIGCFETTDRDKLVLRILKNGVYFFSTDFKFCPFCGYTLGKNESR
jgi:hypothetical protein